MGWETVEHCCGHEAEHQLYGNRAWRARQAERLAQELCPDCKQAERDKENRKAAEANVEAGYPPLEGTEKQIAWAETIRHDMLAVAEVVDEAWSTVREDNQTEWKQVLRESGQPFVACDSLLRNAVLEKYVIIDGFHRYTILKDYLECEQIPIVVLDHDITKRMEATVQFNRARGVHQVELMGDLVASLVKQGVPEDEIAQKLGMELEEVLRLKQVTGIAEIFKNQPYSMSWEMVEVAEDAC